MPLVKITDNPKRWVDPMHITFAEFNQDNALVLHLFSDKKSLFSQTSQIMNQS